MIYYCDGVCDLFHYGHLNFIKSIYDLKNVEDKIYLGIHNDSTVESYKRKPILTMDERIKVLHGVKYIDKIIPNSPLSITKDYIELHNIDIICVPNNRTEKELKLMLTYPYSKKMIKFIEYTSTISTSDIINRITKG